MGPLSWTLEQLGGKESTMSKTRPPYAPEFRQQMVELVRAGRSAEELAREFEPSAQAIRNWLAQADRDEGRRGDGLTSAEREELRRLRRENRRLRLEREILAIGETGLETIRWIVSRRTPGSLGRPARSRQGPAASLRVRENQPGPVPDRHHVPPAGRLRQRLPCVAGSTAFDACPR